MTTDVDALAALAAIEQIKVLKARYFRYLDTKAWSDFGELLTSDCRARIEGGFDRPHRSTAFDSRSEFVAGVSAFLAPAVTVHQGFMPEISLTSSTEATGIWAMADLVVQPDDSPIPSYQGFGHYLEQYRRDDQGWRISDVRLTRIAVFPYPVRNREA